MIIAAVGQKGGVGKTTIAAHLIGWLHERGHSVAAVDADPQYGLTRWIKAALPTVEVIPANSPDEILDRIPELKVKADYVICDGPAGAQEPSRALLLACKLAILPVGPSLLDLDALTQTVKLVQQARKIREGLPDAVVVMNRMQHHTTLSREVREAVPAIGLRVADSILRLRTAMADCFGQGKFIWQMYRAQDATEEMRSLFQEVIDGREKSDGLGQADVEGTGIHPRGEPGEEDKQEGGETSELTS